MGAGQRSFWAWGYEDRLPDEASRRDLAEQVGALLGGGPLEERALPRADALKLLEPRVKPLASVPSSAGTRDRAAHTYGKSYRDLVRGLHGDFSSAPDWIAYPETEGHVHALFEHCAREGLAAIPFGGGTSVVGGVEGAAVGSRYRGVVSIDLRAMNRILEVDRVSRAARIQAGALGPHIERELSPHGLTLRHFPQSFEFSTLGGWIATRAGGHYATLYTHIDDLVESVRMMTPRGVFESRRVPASGAGPDPNAWVLGSEGALGIITEAWMRLQDRPRWRATASVHFGEFAGGVTAARLLAQSGLFPSNCRLLDAREAMLHGVSATGKAVLLVGFESADHPLRPWMDRALEIAKGAGGASPEGATFQESLDARGASDTVAWRRAFLDAPYLQSALVTLGVVVDTFETACTWAAFGALHTAVKDAVRAAMKEACGGGLLTCRFTHVYPDGPAPYYTFLGRGRAGDELAQWEHIKKAASEALHANGATITHHHAVGRVHRPWYDRERPEPFGRMLSAAKRAVDPDAILNPGVLVDP